MLSAAYLRLQSSVATVPCRSSCSSQEKSTIESWLSGTKRSENTLAINASTNSSRTKPARNRKQSQLPSRETASPINNSTRKPINWLISCRVWVWEPKRLWASWRSGRWNWSSVCWEFSRLAALLFHSIPHTRRIVSAFMLEDSESRIVLAQERLLAGLSRAQVQTFSLDRYLHSIAHSPDHDLQAGVTTDNLAYVMYTSGSTGKPKAVMIHHRSVCNYLFWRSDYFPLTESDRVLQKAPLTFDDSVWEIFEPLMMGAQIVMTRPGGHHDSRYLADLIVQQQVTAACFVPSLLRAFLQGTRKREMRITAASDNRRGSIVA